MKITKRQLVKLIREFRLDDDVPRSGSLPPDIFDDIYKGGGGSNTGYIKIYKNEDGTLLKQFYGGNTKETMITALDKAVVYFMNLVEQAKKQGIDIDRDDPADTMGPLTQEELDKQMTILYYSAYPPYDPSKTNEISEPLLQYILNVEPSDVYGVEMYDHIWNNYPGLQARHPGKSAQQIDYEADADYGYAFQDSNTGEIMSVDDLAGEGGMFSGGPAREPYYHALVGLKNKGYVLVDGDPVDELIFRQDRR